MESNSDGLDKYIRCFCIEDMETTDVDTASSPAVRRNQKRKILKHLQEFAEETDVHGIKLAFSGGASRAQAVAWAVIVLGSLSFLTYYICNRVALYRDYPVLTHVALEDGQAVRFPAVTVCHMNEARMSALTPHHFLHLINDLDFHANNLTHRGTHYLSPPQLAQFEGYAEALRANRSEWLRLSQQPLDYRKYILQAGHTPQRSMTYCWFYPLGVRCEHMWRRVFMYPYGTCFSFNAHPGVLHSAAGSPQSGNNSHVDQPLYATQRGRKHGLNVHFNVESAEYNHKRFTTSGGMKALVHTPHTLPDLRRNGIILSAGHLVYMSITSTKLVHNLAAPYSSCESGNPLSHYTRYSLSACESECILRALNTRYRCLRYDQPGDYEVCNKTVMAKYNKDADSMLSSNECWVQCHPPCDRTIYEYQANPAKFSAQRNSRSEHITLFVYFESLVKEIYTEVPAFSTENLLAEIGGMMGLFLGASIITVIHIFEYLLREIGRSFTKQRNKQKELNVK